MLDAWMKLWTFVAHLEECVIRETFFFPSLFVLFVLLLCLYCFSLSLLLLFFLFSFFVCVFFYSDSRMLCILAKCAPKFLERVQCFFPSIFLFLTCLIPPFCHSQRASLLYCGHRGMFVDTLHASAWALVCWVRYVPSRRRRGYLRCCPWGGGRPPNPSISYSGRSAWSQ